MSRFALVLGMLCTVTSAVVARADAPRPGGRIRLDSDEPAPDYALRTLWFLRGGRGPCVVFLHSLGSDDSEWSAEGTRLSATHEVLVIDLPGHGKSVAPATIDLDAVAGQVSGLMREQGCAPAVVVGHSIGGLIAAHVAARDPSAVSGLVVVDSELTPYPFASAKERDTFAAKLRRAHRATLDAFYGRLSQHAQTKQLVDQAMKVDPKVLVGYLWAASSQRLGARATAIKAPTLLMASSFMIDDKVSVPARLAALGFTMPHARLEPFAKSKHWLMWDEPEHFDKVLDAFLQENDRN